MKKVITNVNVVEVKIICDHRFSGNVGVAIEDINLTLGRQTGRSKDPETNKQDFTAMQSANAKLKKLLQKVHPAVVVASNE